MADVQRINTWADDVDELPAPQVTKNADGTKTVVSYRVDPVTHKKVKVTRKIREVINRVQVNHAVAERKKWAKYGAEAGSPAGPGNTTSVDPPMELKMGPKPTKQEQEEEQTLKATASVQVQGTSKVTCRLCQGNHWTAKCPYKDTLGADSDAAAAAASAAGVPSGADAARRPGAVGGSTGYVPPHLRGKTGLPSQEAPMRDRDDGLTLRVSNISPDTTEDDLRYYFSQFGRLARCYLVCDRETGRNRGFAFISYELRQYAEAAQKKMDGVGLDNLILRVEFSKK